MTKSRADWEQHKVQRLLAYTDAVYAIVLTLLVFSLTAPELKNPLSSHELWVELKRLTPKIFAFLLGFLTISTWWVGHYKAFTYLVRVDLVMVWSNNLSLLCMAVLPFVTALIGSYPDNALAVFLYGVVQTVSSCAILLFSTRALKKEMFSSIVDLSTIQRLVNFMKFNPILYIGFTSLAFVNTRIALAVFMLIYIAWIFLIKSIKLKDPSDQSSAIPITL